VGDVAQVLGRGSSIQFEGESYELKPLTYDRIGQFEVWLEERALAAVERHQKRCGPGEYRERMAQAHRDIAACLYSWGGALCWQALNSDRGFCHALYLTLAGSAEVTPEWVKRLYTEQGETVAALFFGANFPKAPGATTETTAPVNGHSDSPRSAASSSTVTA
jgi:hypothetical protein